MFQHSKNTIAIPPGETIREQLEYRGISQKEFAVRMGMSEKHISRLINGKVELTTEVALRLEYVLGISANVWIRLESGYREDLARVKEESEMEQDEELATKFPYKEMEELGWIPAAKKRTEKVMYLRAFFEVARLESLEKLCLPGIAYQADGNVYKNDYAFAVWAQKARMEARKSKTAAIDLDMLNNELSDIKKNVQDNENNYFDKLKEILAECGVALVCIPPIKNERLHGAAFLDGKRIVLGLAEGMEKDKFLYSLFHEIGHILRGHISSTEPITKEQEHQADAFAKQILCL